MNERSQARGVRMWAIVIALVAALPLTSCSVDRRSDELTCVNNGDCGPGQQCEQGLCVQRGMNAVDAQTPNLDPPDAEPGDGGSSLPCGDGCTACDGETCIIACVDLGSCAAGVECPPDVPCEVRCEGDFSCTIGVDCGRASACLIECDGDSACAGAIECGDGACEVVCSGSDSCGGGIDCSDSCRCETDCDGQGSCDGLRECPLAGACERNDGECAAIPSQCDQC